MPLGSTAPPARLRGTPFPYKSPYVTSGNVFWVDSGTGDDDPTTQGRDPSTPFATLDYAIGRCTANNGDVIYVLPGHAETLAAADAVDFDIAGISVVGIGVGSDMPTFTFATAAAADVEVDAANIELANLRFVCNIASQTAMVTLTANADGAYIHDCHFREGTATGLGMILITGVADDVRIEDNEFYVPTAGNGDHAIRIGAAATRLKVKRNFIFGDFDDAGISSASIFTLGVISDNYVTNLLTGQHAIELTAAATGMLVNNRVSTDAIATSIDPGSMRSIGNLFNATGDFEAVPPLPVGDFTTNFIGVDDADNAADTSNVVANTDGSLLERAEYIQTTLLGTADLTTTDTIHGKLGTDTELADRSVYDLINGAGPAAAATAAAPANGVSLYGVARDTWDVLRNGTGGAEPATNRSVMDYLGVTPAFFVPGLGYRITKSINFDTAATEDAFTVTGTVALTLVYGEVTTGLGTTTTLKLNVKTDNVDLCAATTVTGDVDGTMYVLTGDTGAIMNGVDAPTLRVAQTSGVAHTPIIVGNSGGTATIEHTQDQTGTGIMTWTLFYLPLEASATVVAA